MVNFESCCAPTPLIVGPGLFPVGKAECLHFYQYGDVSSHVYQTSVSFHQDRWSALRNREKGQCLADFLNYHNLLVLSGLRSAVPRFKVAGTLTGYDLKSFAL